MESIESRAGERSPEREASSQVSQSSSQLLNVYFTIRKFAGIFIFQEQLGRRGFTSSATITSGRTAIGPFTFFTRRFLSPDFFDRLHAILNQLRLTTYRIFYESISQTVKAHGVNPVLSRVEIEIEMEFYGRLADRGDIGQRSANILKVFFLPAG